MKREFLQNLKADGVSLPPELIDAIMAENGRDIENAGADCSALKEQVRRLSEELSAKNREHKRQLEDLAFEAALREAISAAKGRNVKAIAALLDVDALKKSRDQSRDIADALEALKKECAYLFDTEQTPPPYAAGTGAGFRLPGGAAPALAAMRAAAGVKIY